MRQGFLLIFILFLFSCAPPRPVSWTPELKPFSGAKGLVAYDISTPKGQFKGEAFFLSGSDFVYFEVPSFWGPVVFQGILAGQKLIILNFLANKAYVLEMRDILAQEDIPWGVLFLGVFPESWLKKATSFATKKGYRLDVKLSEKYKIQGYFSKLGILKKIEIKISKGTLKFIYEKDKTFLEIPRLRSKAQFFFRQKTLLDKKPKSPPVSIPPYFEMQIYSF
ncbi:hypothetical protein [Thermodesulfatator autotrophicus]|uniref:Uncharacterized protein n=1 Tax=Thermodesulfatator autotrophicus TaxID=1795632 RepID=A0A177E457_9BACT|nr:hypothetical protein [Thermodesulfatator autotrophicus]OAG26753.1 hypothetical protein TH606_10610 [Thermodesulfatator autotrophicus]